MLDKELKDTKEVILETFDLNCHEFFLETDPKGYYLKYENNTDKIRTIILRPNAWFFTDNSNYPADTNYLFKPLNNEKNISFNKKCLH